MSGLIFLPLAVVAVTLWITRVIIEIFDLRRRIKL